MRRQRAPPRRWHGSLAFRGERRRCCGKEVLMFTPANANREARFGLATFDAYNVAIRFYREVCAAAQSLRGNVVDHLLASAESVALNVGEAHPAIGPERARKFRI